MNKKGIGATMVLWLPRIFFLVIVMLTIIFLTRFVVAVYIDTVEAQAHVYTSRILFDKDGIIRYDNGRAYPGVIQLAKFSEERLNKTIHIEKENEGACAKLTLTNLETDRDVTTYWNKRWYEQQRPRSSFRGIGSPYLKKTTMLVSIYQNKRYVPAILEIEMLVPRK